MSSNFINCPLCQMPCTDFQFDHRLDVNHCNSCNTLWLDHGELELIVGTKKTDCYVNTNSSGLRNNSAAACPRCSDVQLSESRVNNFQALTCQKCKGNLISAPIISALRSSIAHKRHQFVTFPKHQHAGSSLNEDSLFFADSQSVRTFSIPVALLIGALSELSEIRILIWFFTNLFHELGHAFVKWVSGCVAIPLPFFTYWQNERSTSLILFFHILWTAGIWLALRLVSQILLAVFFVLLVMQSVFSFLIPLEKINEIALLYGIGGEIIFGALLVSSFTWTLPRQLRWDFWRYPALLAGGILFASNAVNWLKIKHGIRSIPWGAVIGEESDGDLARLRDSYNWTEASLTSHYLLLIKIGIIWIAMHYLVRLFSTQPQSGH